MKEISKGKKYLKSKGLILSDGSISNEKQTWKILEYLKPNSILPEILLGSGDLIYLVIDKEKGNLHIDFPIVRETEKYKIYQV